MRNRSDQYLLSRIQLLVKTERKILKQILESLQEIYERRLFADLGHSSLFKFLVKELKYSEAAASRRVGALKLTQKTTLAKEMIASGELNLSNASQANTFATNEGLNKQEIDKLLIKIKDRTTKEVQEMLNLGPIPKNEVKRQSDEETRITITISNKSYEKLEILKASYKKTTTEIIEDFINSELHRYEKSLNKTNIVNTIKHSRHIPSKIKKALKIRASHSCEYPGCDEKRFLEVEHVQPFAKGGLNELKNLKLFCKTHNQRSAIKEFGLGKMRRFMI